jgi:hypothetical protein
MREMLYPDQREIPEHIPVPVGTAEMADEKGTGQREIPEHIPVPDQRTTATLWLIVIITLALILVGSFLTLAVSVFVSPPGDGRQIILTIFTTSTSFLAGLFATSPFQAMGKKD